jgi:hypothetical protein
MCTVVLNSNNQLTKRSIMKRTVQFLKFACFILFCGGLMLTCRKNDTMAEEPGNPTDPNPPGTEDSAIATADTIANHLQFFNAVKKMGIAPKGAAGSSLKISFKDTLYLMDELKRPIKFQHEDAAQNVAGAYIQVHYGMAGGASSFYYDVPEEPEIGDNDTVSVLFAGIDPNGLTGLPGVPPASVPSTFEITITPYDKAGNPIATETRPVSTSENKRGGGNGSACGLVLDVGEYWEWELSYSFDKNSLIEFMNDPYKVWGAGGQFIKGSCCNGNSVYGVCPGDTAANSGLRFVTRFQFLMDMVTFFPNGTFIGASAETHNLPAPDESDFCGSGKGIVKLSTRSYQKSGTYTVNKTKLPARFPQSWRHDDTLMLTLRQTAPVGYSGGVGNASGVIHALDCDQLVVMQLDREGGNSDLYRFYRRITNKQPHWYPFG